MTYYSLKSGVGRGQRNDSMDVLVVQVLLAKFQYPIRATGIYSNELQTSIETFQRVVEKQFVPSGTVTPSSSTLRRLEMVLGIPYKLASSNLLLSAGILDVIRPMGVRFYCNARPNKRMTINSGRRTTESQADAMYTKLAKGDDIVRLYKDKSAAKAIADSYAEAVRAKKSVAEKTAAIKAKLDEQVSRGINISNHFSAKAVDVKSLDLSPAQHLLFEKIAKEYCRLVIHEKKPPHFHLELH